MARLLVLLVVCGLPAPLLAHPSLGQAFDAPAWTGGLENSDIVPDTTEPWRYYPLAVGNKWEFTFDYFTFYGRFIERVTDKVTINGTPYFELTFTFFDVTIHPNSPQHVEFRNSSTNLVRFDTLTSHVMVWRDAGQFEEPWNRFWPHWGDDACPLDGHFGDTCPGTNIWIEGGYNRPFVFGGPWPGTGPDMVHTAIKEFWISHGGNDQNNAFFAADIGYIYSDGKYHNEYLYYALIDGQEYGISQFPIGTDLLPTGTKLHIELYPNPSSGMLHIDLPQGVQAIFTYQISDILGRRIARGTFDTTSGTVDLDLSQLPMGMYIFAIMEPFTVSTPFQITR